MSASREKELLQVLNDEGFAILLLITLFTTFIMAIYKPTRRSGSVSSSSSKKLHCLACAHGPGNISSLINLIKSSRPVNKNQLKFYIMLLVKLAEHSSSIVMVQRVRRNKLSFVSRFNYKVRAFQQRVAAAFRAYGQMGMVVIRTTTAISALSTTHEDICDIAKENSVPMIILAFHKRWIKTHGPTVVENVGHGCRGVNQRVLTNAKCSVAILVERGVGDESQQNMGSVNTATQKTCVIFFGGPDDRECLELARRMVEHPAVNVTFLRFVEGTRVEHDGVGLRLTNYREVYKG